WEKSTSRGADKAGTAGSASRRKDTFEDGRDLGGAAERDMPATTRSPPARSPAGLDDGIGIVAEGGRVVVDQQVGGDDVVAVIAQLAFDEVPVPADIAGAVDGSE